MLTHETLSYLEKIIPTPEDYEKYKRLVTQYEKLLNEDKEIDPDKQFYVHMGWDIYQVGTFDGFQGNQIRLKIEERHWVISDLKYVFETKQEFMKRKN